MAEHSISYEELAQTYQQCAQGNARPDCMVGTLESAVYIWGAEEVERMIADGRLTFLTEELDD